jgi:hypothetical protein
MHVNVKKTKIMVFNRTDIESCLCFTYDKQIIEIVNEFKYLGIMFHAIRRHAITIEHRVAQGKRLIAIWMRRCNVWLINPAMAEQLFKTCVMPALEYGIGLWGSGNYKSGAWLKLETFWRMAARIILGAPLRTPTEALLGELGWTKFWVRGAWQAVCMWTRITRTSDDALVRKAMHVQRRLFAKKKSCWLKRSILP